MSKISSGLCLACVYCLSAVCLIDNVTDLGSDISLLVTNTLLIIPASVREMTRSKVRQHYVLSNQHIDVDHVHLINP